MKVGYDTDMVKLLGPAIEAGRSALRAMEAKEVPAGLKKVKAYSGGKLPPPLAVSLVAALDTDEALRARAIEVAPPAVVDGAGPAERASAAFLGREEGWWSVIAAARSEAALAASAAREQAAGKRAEKSEAKAAEAMRREQEARTGARDAVAETSAQVTELRERVRAAQEAGRRATAPIEAALRRAEEARSRAETELESVRDQLSELSSRWRRARRELAEAERAARAGSSGSLPGDPLARAKRLDEIATLSRVPVEAAPARPGGAGDPTVFAVPPGVAPDRAGAIEWLIAEPRRFTAVVDGYNVTFLFTDAFSTGAARDQLNLALGRLQRAMRAGKVIVVYDSKLAGQRRSIEGPDGIEVRFSPEGTTADDAVVAMAGDHEGPVVVISTDREVRDRAAARGAVTLWSEALVEWIRG